MGNGGGTCSRVPTQRVVRLDEPEEATDHGALPIPVCGEAQDGPIGWCCKKNAGPHVQVVGEDDDPEDGDSKGPQTSQDTSQSATILAAHNSAEAISSDPKKTQLSTKELEQWEFAVEESSAQKLDELKTLQTLGLPSQDVTEDTDGECPPQTNASVRGLELLKTPVELDTPRGCEHDLPIPDCAKDIVGWFRTNCEVCTVFCEPTPRTPRVVHLESLKDATPPAIQEAKTKSLAKSSVSSETSAVDSLTKANNSNAALATDRVAAGAVALAKSKTGKAFEGEQPDAKLEADKSAAGRKPKRSCVNKCLPRCGAKDQRERITVPALQAPVPNKPPAEPSPLLSAFEPNRDFVPASQSADKPGGVAPGESASSTIETRPPANRNVNPNLYFVTPGVSAPKPIETNVPAASPTPNPASSNVSVSPTAVAPEGPAASPTPNPDLNPSASVTPAAAEPEKAAVASNV